MVQGVAAKVAPQAGDNGKIRSDTVRRMATTPSRLQASLTSFLPYGCGRTRFGVSVRRQTVATYPLDGLNASMIGNAQYDPQSSPSHRREGVLFTIIFTLASLNLLPWRLPLDMELTTMATSYDGNNDGRKRGERTSQFPHRPARLDLAPYPHHQSCPRPILETLTTFIRPTSRSYLNLHSSLKFV